MLVYNVWEIINYTDTWQIYWMMLFYDQPEKVKDAGQK